MPLGMPTPHPVVSQVQIAVLSECSLLLTCAQDDSSLWSEYLSPFPADESIGLTEPQLLKTFGEWTLCGRTLCVCLSAFQINTNQSHYFVSSTIDIPMYTCSHAQAHTHVFKHASCLNPSILPPLPQVELFIENINLRDYILCSRFFYGWNHIIPILS